MTKRSALLLALPKEAVIVFFEKEREVSYTELEKRARAHSFQLALVFTLGSVSRIMGPLAEAAPLTEGSMHMYCFYYHQGVPGETVSSPNAFRIMGVDRPSDPITLGKVKRSFPLNSRGTFHWRFREEATNGSEFIWRDFEVDSDVLPKYQGKGSLLRLGFY